MLALSQTLPWYAARHLAYPDTMWPVSEVWLSRVCPTSRPRQVTR
jgi:hypothetical protein